MARNNGRSAVALAVVVGLLAGVFASYAWSGSKKESAEPVPNTPSPTAPAPAPEPSVEPSPEPTPEPWSFTLVSGGDVLIHMPVLSSAKTPEGYDFVPLMSGVQPFVEDADLALCHLEVPIVPDGESPSGYPMFGAPAVLIDNLKTAGWDGCSTASNHTVDRKFAGLSRTIDQFEANGMGWAGSARSEDEFTRTQMYTVSSGDQSVTVAHISSTYGLNGLPVPSQGPWSVNTFDADAANVEPVLKLAQQARDQGADIVVASIHCCVEYRTDPTDAQRSIAQQLADSGLVDVYIGHHAHVPQPIELLSGGPRGDGMWTAFGLGNYLHNQSSDCCIPETSNGLIATTTFVIAPDGDIDIGMEWTAITVDRRGGHRMYALADIPDGVGNLSASEVAARYERVRAAVGDAAPERREPAGKQAESVTVGSRTS